MIKTMAWRIGFTICLVAALFCLAACQPSENMIRAGVSQELETLKSFNKEIYDKYGFEKSISSSFEMLGIDGYEFMEAYFMGFDYEVGEIAINGDSVDVELTLSMRRASDLQAELTSMMTSANPEEFKGMSQDQIYKELGKRFMDILRGDSVPLSSQTVHVEGIKEGSGWNFEKSMTKAVSSFVAS